MKRAWGCRALCTVWATTMSWRSSGYHPHLVATTGLTGEIVRHGSNNLDGLIEGTFRLTTANLEELSPGDTTRNTCNLADLSLIDPENQDSHSKGIRAAILGRHLNTRWRLAFTDGTGQINLVNPPGFPGGSSWSHFGIA